MGVTELQITTGLIVLALGVSLASSEMLMSMAKPGCVATCGNVTIPFPFGVGDSNCFFDEWYELLCDKSVNPNQLLHKRMKLEVLNVTIPGSDNFFYDQNLLVRAPISFFNCPGNNATGERVDLTGAPFSFSPYNLFVAASCGVRAYLNSSSLNEFLQMGCTSSCSTDNTAAVTHQDGISCTGIDCCQTSMTSILDKSYEISFDDSTSNFVEKKIGDQCKFAFVIDRQYWLLYKNETSNLTKLRDVGYVPLLLDWNLTDHSLLDNSSRGWYTRSKAHSCVNMQSFHYDISSSTKYICSCESGFRGNPYLVDGCSQDINECEDRGYNPCSSGSRCVNTYGDYYCSYKKKFLLIGFGSAFGALFLLICLWGLYKKIQKRREIKRKRKFFKRNGGLLLQQQLSPDESNNIEKTKLFDSNELDKATLHFSVDRILGQGGQGTVYKGMLDDGKIVAVKKSKIVDEEKLSEFINEVVILSQINHRNVVQLLGCCLETEVPILVYEFIPNGTLSQYINDRNDEFPFTWKLRLRVAAEVAGALSYLHSAASFPIYHRDIKSSNILLDEKYKAKVADFGTSRTIALEQTHLTTLVYGTFGYLDPEYFQSSQFTDKSDVYSFGVVLVELLTGQKAICASRAEEGRNLATYFTISMEANCLFDIIDRQVIEEGTKEEILVVACLALRCLNLSGRNRPTMKEVAMELEGLQKSEKASTDPRQNYEEIEYARTELIKPWDDVTMLTAAIESTGSGSSLQQELPLLSFGSK